MPGQPRAPRGLVYAISHSSRRDWFGGLKSIAWALLPGLVPFLVAGMVRRFVPQPPPPFSNLFVHGELALYGFALAVTCTRLIAYDAPDAIDFADREMFALVALLLIVLNLILYMIPVFAASGAGMAVPAPVMAWLSGLLLALTFFFFFLVEVLHHQRSRPDYAHALKDDEAELSKQFRARRRDASGAGTSA